MIDYTTTARNLAARALKEYVNHFYIEVTYNGDKKEAYCDVYEKRLNKAYKE